MSKIITGKSGLAYLFDVYPFPDQEFKKDRAAVYVIGKTNPHGLLQIIYVGETDDLSARFDNHHKASCFSNNGADAIGIHDEDDENKRLEIERDLKAQFEPVCND